VTCVQSVHGSNLDRAHFETVVLAWSTCICHTLPYATLTLCNLPGVTGFLSDLS
jgi:hypothetical protein